MSALRWLGAVAAAVASIVAAAIVCVLMALAFLSTPWGASRLARAVEDRIGDAIRGELRIHRLEFRGLMHLRAGEVEILDPDGRPVIAADSVDATVDLSDLLRGRLVVRELAIRGGRVEVAPFAPGGAAAIGVAFEPARPRIAAPSRHVQSLPPPPPFPIELDRLRIEDAAFRLAQAQGGEAEVLVRGIQVAAAGSWSDGGASVSLWLTGVPLQPLVAPLRVEVVAGFADDRLEARPARVRLGTTWLRAKGAYDFFSHEGEARFHARVGRREARAMGTPLASDLVVAGASTQRADRNVSRVKIEAGGGAIDLFATIDDALETQVSFRALDPSRWVIDAPAGDLAGNLSVQARRRSRRAHARLRLDRGSLLQAPVGPADVSAELFEGDEGVRAEFAPSQLEIADSSLRFHGLASGRAIDLQGSAELRRIESLRELVERLTGASLDDLGGSGKLVVAARGSPRDPEVEGSVDLDELRYAGWEATTVQLRGEGRLDPERLPVGWIDGCVGGLGGGALRFNDTQLSLKRDPGGAFEARLSSSATPPGRDAGALQLDASGTLHRDRGHLLLRRAAFANEALDFASRADLGWEQRRLRGTIAAAVGGVGAIRADVDGPIDPARAPPSAPIALDLRADPVDLRRLGILLGQELPQGLLHGRLVSSGTLAHPRVEADVRIGGLRPSEVAVPMKSSHARNDGAISSPAPRATAPSDLRDLPAFDAAATLSFADGSVQAKLQLIQGRAKIAEIAAVAPLELERLRRDPRAAIRQMLDSRQSRIAGDAMGVDLALVGALIGRSDLRGAANASMDLRGPLRDPRGSFRSSLRGGPFGPLRDVAMDADAHFDDDEIRVEGSLATAGQSPASISLHLGASPADLLARRLEPATPIAARVDLAGFDLAVLPWGREGRGSGRRRSEEEPPGLVGSLSYHLDLRGSLRKLEGSSALEASGLGWAETELGDVSVQVELAADSLDARLHAIDAAAGTFSSRLQLGAGWSAFDLFDRGPAALRRVESRLEIEAQSLAVGSLAGVLGVSRAAGTLDLDIVATGPLDDLLPIGQIALSQGAVELPGGIIYDRIGMEVRLAEGLIELRSLDVHTARSGGAFLTGSLGGAGTRPFSTILQIASDGALGAEAPAAPISLGFRATSLPVGGAGGVAARVTGQGALDGTIDPRAGAAASLYISPLEIELPEKSPRSLQAVGIPEDVVVVTGRKARKRASERARQASLPVELRLRLPPRFIVQGDDLHLEAEADLSIRRLRDATLRVDGTARTLRGTIKVLGRPFTIEHAELRWIGSPPGDPHLEVTGRVDASQATAWADLTGTVDDPTIRLRSEPPLPENQIVMLIISGRTRAPGLLPVQGEPAPTGAETGAPGAAASVAGSLLAQKLRQALGPRVPLQVLTVETTGSQTQLEAGTFVGRRLYLGYVRNFLPEPGENTNEARAEYELSRTIGIQTRLGDAGAGGVELVWDKEVATVGQQRARREASQQEAPDEPARQEMVDEPARRDVPDGPPETGAR